MKIAIIKYNAGNIRSVSFALNRLGIAPIITDDPEELRSADRIIFPGVGEATSAMSYLKERKLDNIIKELKQPFLGICLGMQLMCNNSEERNTDCLGIFDVQVKRFPAIEKVPHMGWNTISKLNSPLLKGINENSYVYFVHSFYVEKNLFSIANCNYIVDFCAGISRDNFHAFQFHPEKSGIIGEKILKNFVEM